MIALMEKNNPAMGYDQGAGSFLARPVSLDGFVDMAKCTNNVQVAFHVSHAGT